MNVNVPWIARAAVLSHRERMVTWDGCVSRCCGQGQAKLREICALKLQCWSRCNRAKRIAREKLFWVVDIHHDREAKQDYYFNRILKTKSFTKPRLLRSMEVRRCPPGWQIIKDAHGKCMCVGNRRVQCVLHHSWHLVTRPQAELCTITGKRGGTATTARTRRQRLCSGWSGERCKGCVHECTRQRGMLSLVNAFWVPFVLLLRTRDGHAGVPLGLNGHGGEGAAIPGAHAGTVPTQPHTVCHHPQHGTVSPHHLAGLCKGNGCQVASPHTVAARSLTAPCTSCHCRRRCTTSRPRSAPPSTPSCCTHLACSDSCTNCIHATKCWRKHTCVFVLNDTACSVSLCCAQVLALSVCGVHRGFECR